MLCACAPKPAVPINPPPPPPDAAVVVVDAPPQRTDIDSKAILERTDIANEVLVKHVLFGWKDLIENYNGHLDPRAANRTQAEAARLAESVAAQLRADPSKIDALAKEHSEDPGSLRGEPYKVTQDGAFVPEFSQLALRLAMGEVGIVTTTFGYHVMIRVAPPPPDPLESVDILARAPTSGEHFVRHILIGWDGKSSNSMDAKSRTKDEADRLAKSLYDQIKGGADIIPLMKQYSEDPGSASTGTTYTVTETSPMVDQFKNLALRLNENEVGMVITQYGWHVIKRFPPPPPDPIESAAILKRTTVAEHVKVKHILIGEAKAKGRDAQAKVVTATLAKLKSGAKFDKLMAELSEDPGGGDGYEVTPDAGLVEPFKRLSLRLKVNEIGVVKTEFGFHIVKRLE